MSDFALHWLRPWWLAGLLPLGLLVFNTWRQQHAGSAWESIVDPALQSYVIEPGDAHRPWAAMALFSGWLLGLLVLAGPVWHQQEVPVFQAQQAQVILFDLSHSMLTEDIKPNRLARARFKLHDLLAQAKGSQVALVGFSERPYVISPLTDDVSTVAAFVSSLSPDIMPIQGSRADLAIEKGLHLLAQAKVTQGQLVLITDTDVTEPLRRAAQATVAAGHILSVLSVGTTSGAPLRGADGRFVQDATGAVVVPRINPQALGELAKLGGGVAVELSSDGQDVSALLAIQQQLAVVGNISDIRGSEQYWIEYGPWLLLLLCAGALLLFRRGLAW